MSLKLFWSDLLLWLWTSCNLVELATSKSPLNEVVIINIEPGYAWQIFYFWVAIWKRLYPFKILIISSAGNIAINFSIFRNFGSTMHSFGSLISFWHVRPRILQKLGLGWVHLHEPLPSTLYLGQGWVYLHEPLPRTRFMVNSFAWTPTERFITWARESSFTWTPMKYILKSVIGAFIYMNSYWVLFLGPVKTYILKSIMGVFIYMNSYQVFFLGPAVTYILKSVQGAFIQVNPQWDLHIEVGWGSVYWSKPLMKPTSWSRLRSVYLSKLLSRPTSWSQLREVYSSKPLPWLTFWIWFRERLLK